MRVPGVLQPIGAGGGEGGLGRGSRAVLGLAGLGRVGHHGGSGGEKRNSGRDSTGTGTGPLREG
jgi:hypothetical protein